MKAPDWLTKRVARWAQEWINSRLGKTRRRPLENARLRERGAIRFSKWRCEMDAQLRPSTGLALRSMDFAAAARHALRAILPTADGVAEYLGQLDRMRNAQIRLSQQRQREWQSHQVPRRSKKHAWKVARAAGRAA